MKTKIISVVSMFLSVSLLSVLSLFPESSGADKNDKTSAAAKRENREAKQAENQNMTAYETDLVRKIRSVIADDARFSMAAKNVVITANNGKILLQGSVASAEEKARVVETAKLHSGAMTVVDQTVINR